MALTSGTKLGPYEIQAPLGAGGMGEVYRARDTRLDRTVAVKVLPTHLSDNPEARQRFEREARAISSLNHPNICILHDVGYQDGVDYLVMEYLEGETLADRLMKGPLPLDQALKCGVGICEGLEKAHGSGVIHRDLKPGNIMLTKSGVKLMDFGLAKLIPAVNPHSPGLAETLPSLAGGHPLTAKGFLVGTFQYISPEQVEGKEADARSDIFALGAVLYEMATGRRAFEGKTTASVIAAVLERDPAPISKGQPMSPPALDHLVGSCLAKNPENRWQTVHDIRLELQWIAQDGAKTGAAAGRSASSSTHWLAWLLAFVMALAVVFLVVWNMEHIGPRDGPLRASLLPPAKSSFAPYNFTLSPDGRRLAFVAVADDGSTALWVRSLASGATQQFSNTADARFPFWSPDGRWVAFFAEGKLKKLEGDTGSVQTICDARSGWGGDWNRDDVLIFAGDVAGPLSRVPAAGGVPVPVTKLIHEASSEGHRWPSFLPDGKHFLYQVDWVGAAGTYIGSLDGGESKLLSHDLAGDVHFVAGYLVFVRNGSLMAQPFDPQLLQFKADPIPIVPQDVEAEKAFSHGNLALLQFGHVVGQTRDADNDSGGELEQIQFLLGHASVQTTERYLGCKQNLGSPVNDRFKLRTEVQQREPNFGSAAVKGATPVETTSREGIQCRHGGHEDERPVEPNSPSPPERADLVEVRKGHRPHSLRRCSEPGASRSDSGSKANGQRDPEVVGSVGPGTSPDPTP